MKHWTDGGKCGRSVLVRDGSFYCRRLPSFKLQGHEHVQNGWQKRKSAKTLQIMDGNHGQRPHDWVRFGIQAPRQQSAAAEPRPSITHIVIVAFSSLFLPSHNHHERKSIIIIISSCRHWLWRCSLLHHRSIITSRTCFRGSAAVSVGSISVGYHCYTKHTQISRCQAQVSTSCTCIGTSRAWLSGTEFVWSQVILQCWLVSNVDEYLILCFNTQCICLQSHFL